MAEPTDDKQNEQKLAQVVVTLDLDTFRLLITGRVPNAMIALAMLRAGVDEYEYINTMARHQAAAPRVTPAGHIPSRMNPGNN